MAAYIIFTIGEVTNPDLMQEYQKGATAFLPTQGVFMSAGPKVAETLEGSPLAAAAIIPFDSIDEAKAWYLSPEYQELVKIRKQAATGDVFILEGP